MPNYPIVGSAYESLSKSWEYQRTVNLMMEASQSGQALKPICLFGTPGHRLLATLTGPGGVRCTYECSTGDSIVVVGANVYRVSTAWVGNLIGTLSTSAGIVSIADNGQEAMIVDGSLIAFSLDLTSNTMSQITDPDFLGADQVRFLDTYFVFFKAGTETFYITDSNSTDVDALDFASAEGSPDDMVALEVYNRELWLFGKNTTEVWYNISDRDFPFARLNGAFVEVGCEAQNSVVPMDNSLFWLGRDRNGGRQVFRSEGYRGVRISTHALEREMRGYSLVSDAVAYAYQINGHSLYVINFPAADRTWMYDISVGRWFELAWHDSNSEQRRDRGQCHMHFGGEHVIGDWETGKLYALDFDYYTHNGDSIRRIRQGPELVQDGRRWMFLKWFEVEFETGVGLTTGQGSTPQCVIDWSDDGAHTFKPATTVNMGAIGQYRARARCRMGGRSRGRVFRVTISDPVKVVIISASFDMDVGTS